MSDVPPRARSPRGWSGAGTLARAVAQFATRRAAIVVALVAALSLIALLLALGLHTSAATDTFVDRDSSAFQATERFHRQFGDDPITVLVRARRGTDLCKPSCRLVDMLLTEDLARITALEGCLAGNLPRGARPLSPVCTEIARRKRIKAVYGPGTFINESARQISSRFSSQGSNRAVEADRAAEAARRLAKAKGLPPADQDRLARRARELVLAQAQRDALALGLRYGLSSVPSLNNPEFVLRLVFEPSLGAAVPKSRFAYLFPNERSALIQVRLRPGLGDSEKKETIELAREAVASPAFKLVRGEYLVSGVPVVTAGVASSVSGSLRGLLLAAVILMAITLALVFRSGLRMLPLALALSATALTFGAMRVAGVPLTIATIAVLPVVIGLAVDYAIQFQARVQEGGSVADAASAGAPVIATAGLATAAGFLTMLFSPIPMVRSFAVLVVVGIVLAFVVTLTAGVAILSRYRGGRSRPPRPLPRRAGAALAMAVGRPRAVLGIALAAAVLGWAAGTQIDVVSDVQRLVPGDLREIEDVHALEDETGVSGDVDVVVRSRDLTEPAVVRWMVDYQRRVLRRHGYSEQRRCRDADLCPALSLTNLLGTGAGSPRQIKAVLDALPRYFSQAVVSRDRRTANIAFGIRVMPLDKQERLIDDMRSQLDPPPGVRAELAGTPVLAADANADLESSRQLVTLAGLAAVFLVLLAVYRRLIDAIVPLIPIALATGWSALVLFVVQIPLNPMSATLGALVIAVSTEFAVILTARYRQERAAGLPLEAALERTYERTGAAVLASATTAIVGFGALITSDVRMLRDFGVVTVVDLTVALLGVMLVLPAALVWAEQRGPIRIPRSRAEFREAAARALPRGR
jgi:hydrophobe/amphiphile efflux-3 (HAE3) family protein